MPQPQTEQRRKGPLNGESRNPPLHIPRNSLARPCQNSNPKAPSSVLGRLRQDLGHTTRLPPRVGECMSEVGESHCATGGNQSFGKKKDLLYSQIKKFCLLFFRTRELNLPQLSDHCGWMRKQLEPSEQVLGCNQTVTHMPVIRPPAALDEDQAELWIILKAKIRFLYVLLSPTVLYFVFRAAVSPSPDFVFHHRPEYHCSHSQCQ